MLRLEAARDLQFLEFKAGWPAAVISSALGLLGC